MEAPDRTLVVAGAGRVATAVAILLQRAGFEVTAVASRTHTSARRAGERLGAPINTIPEAGNRSREATGAPDAGIAEITGRIAQRLRANAVL
jgi:phosphoglycerate dehydrogenase-like enzyme